MFWVRMMRREASLGGIGREGKADRSALLFHSSLTGSPQIPIPLPSPLLSLSSLPLLALFSLCSLSWSMATPNLAPEIIQRIAFNLATQNPTGPPSGLLPLLTASPYLYAALNINDNPTLYADIFKHTFDTSAIRRRFPASNLTARALAVELQRRWISLKRLRAMSNPIHGAWFEKKRNNVFESIVKEDLMTAFLMLVESDGRNAVHLLQWAKLDTYLENYMQRILVPIHSEPAMPPASESTSLLLWVMWLVSDYRECGCTQARRVL